MVCSFLLQGGSGLAGSVAGIAAAAGAIVLVLMVVAMGAFAYKSLQGDGIRWPDDIEEGDPEDDGVRESHGDDDEWKYY